jgi:hypothetical protein
VSLGHIFVDQMIFPKTLCFARSVFNNHFKPYTQISDSPDGEYETVIGVRIEAGRAVVNPAEIYH